MRYLVTHLKAPWPQGTAVGDVVDFDEVPAWAIGKCTAAGEGSVASAARATAGPDLQIELDDARRALAVTQDDLKRQSEFLEGLQSQLREAGEELRAANDAKAKAEKEAAELRALLDAASQPSNAPVDRAALETEAKALGVDFSPNIGDKKLAERIAEAKAAKQ
ncbi:hypothetical protein [Xylophilus sp. GOD-11R]|uniref:hypothetical protein n=1 Tax=Xylophilus sp. GOD-11R TaxID=3089814 RepID=UPI00298CE692|nr:hypothetical protein [Xylophilus sp. GOD-11R]WPB58635.1 hypothetical protein R9X41_08365 [Xylophilus sp. GOD-11R]